MKRLVLIALLLTAWVAPAAADSSIKFNDLIKAKDPWLHWRMNNHDSWPGNGPMPFYRECKDAYFALPKEKTVFVGADLFKQQGDFSWVSMFYSWPAHIRFDLRGGMLAIGDSDDLKLMSIFMLYDFTDLSEDTNPDNEQLSFKIKAWNCNPRRGPFELEDYVLEVFDTTHKYYDYHGTTAPMIVFRDGVPGGDVAQEYHRVEIGRLYEHCKVHCIKPTDIPIDLNKP